MQKPKRTSNDNPEHHKNELLSKSFFSQYKYQLSYLAKFSKNVKGEELFTNGYNRV